MGFNVGLALFNNDFTKIHNMSLIEDYVQFEATLWRHNWETEERKTYETKLTLNSCNQDDFNIENSYLDPFFMCLPNSNKITATETWKVDHIRGEFNSK